ncbi:MAG TPA: N-acetylneuraminate synthase family protein [Gammaproteobacteria bacterium]|nr:N-acetylneuraminate synthase family protein [Gammaproteobacteria bacterium]
MSEFSFKRVWGPVPSYPNVLSYQRPDDKFIVISGPCSVESEKQINFTAGYVAIQGATHLRGGVFRAGTYPGKNFGWINEDLIKSYSDAAKSAGLKNIIEVLDYRDLDFISKYTDCFQVGCRQMQNYTLLRNLGAYKKPVFLKRHPGSTLDEFLGAAEHLLVGGVTELYLIERGSSTHLNHVRWDLSISMIPTIKNLTKIPIICDASHGTGRRDLVIPMALAGIAAGADGILVETHPDPDKSLSDAEQAIGFLEFRALMYKAKKVRSAIN